MCHMCVIVRLQLNCCDVFNSILVCSVQYVTGDLFTLIFRFRHFVYLMIDENFVTFC